jgi:hypothetical protein
MRKGKMKNVVLTETIPVAGGLTFLHFSVIRFS